MTLICIDPGHGGAQPGACNGKYEEKTATLQISRLIAAKLQNEGFKVIMTRDSDTDVSLKRRCEISNKAGADAFISIHLNSCHSKTPHGAETWKWHATRMFSLTLADNVQKELVAQTGAANRGVRASDTYYVLRHTKASALVVECGFISNDAECVKLFTPSYQEECARGIVFGIMRAFKET